MKKIIRTLIFVLAIASTFNYIEVNAQEIKASTDIVDIPDKNLKVCINQELGHGDNEDITNSQMKNLLTLRCQDKAVKNLEGLQTSDLRTIYLNDNQISDLTPLSKLTNLHHVVLSKNQISDLTPISNLTSMDELVLSGNQISDISSFAKLIKLKNLYLNDNQISDISPLKGLTNLENLYLNDNQISDISSVSNLISIEKLGLDHNQISDLTPLAAISNSGRVKTFTLGYNQISDLNPLEDAARVKTLVLNNNRISDISPLGKIPKAQLTNLNLNDNQITDISALSNLTSLTTLYLSNNPLTDLSPISKLTNLTILDLVNTQTSDLTNLRDLTKLGQLDLSENQISDVTPIQSLSKLTTLNLSNNQIVDFSPLGYKSINGLDTSSQNISIDLGEFYYLKDIPKDYKIKIIEQFGTEHEVITPIDNVKTGINLYTQVYDFEDKSVAGNRYSGKVNVTFKYKNEKPVIDGLNDVTLNINDSFDPMQGISALDAEDGDLTSKIIITNNTLDTAKVGSYKITYSVTDSEGGKTVGSRNIKVVDKATSKPGGDITQMKPGDKNESLSKTGSNMLVVNILAIAALLLIKKSYKL